MQHQHQHRQHHQPRGPPGKAGKEAQVYAGPYILEESIGQGSTGKVKAGYHSQTGRKVAIKIVKKSVLQNNPDVRQRVEREIKVLKLLRHVNIMELVDVMQTSSHLFVILEHLEGGELYDKISRDGGVDPVEAFRLFYQLVTGVTYMHSQNICHRDLKLENLLLDASGNLKIGDFSMASAIPRDGYLETSCGSPHYACPEIVKGGRYLGPAADTWSCGVLLYALTTGSLPFDSPNVEQLFEKICAGSYTIPPSLSPSLRDLISRMLQVDSADRIRLDELQSHQYWIENLVHVT